MKKLFFFKLFVVQHLKIKWIAFISIGQYKPHIISLLCSWKYLSCTMACETDTATLFIFHGCRRIRIYFIMPLYFDVYMYMIFSWWTIFLKKILLWMSSSLLWSFLSCWKSWSIQIIIAMLSCFVSPEYQWMHSFFTKWSLSLRVQNFLLNVSCASKQKAKQNYKWNPSSWPS